MYIILEVCAPLSQLITDRILKGIENGDLPRLCLYNKLLHAWLWLLLLLINNRTGRYVQNTSYGCIINTSDGTRTIWGWCDDNTYDTQLRMYPIWMALVRIKSKIQERRYYLLARRSYNEFKYYAHRTFSSIVIRWK